MPSLPGSWQRRIDWMVGEGEQVNVGDLVVRLDPGDLITREEQLRTDLEKVRMTANRRIDELKLELMDAEKAVAQAASDVRLAELDAVIPAATIPRLDYERNQLTLATAKKTLIRMQAALLNKQAELADVTKETRLEIAQAESNYERIRLALEATEIRAEKAGFMIYGENPFTGKKVFPGETLYSGFEVAAIANRDDLQIRFWVHEADILKLGLGQAIEVAADAQGATPFLSRLTWTSSQAVEKQDWSDSGYFEALAKPSEKLPDEIMPGMSVMGLVSTRETDR
jgi:multidrug resistance efflux pump